MHGIPLKLKRKAFDRLYIIYITILLNISCSRFYLFAENVSFHFIWNHPLPGCGCVRTSPEKIVPKWGEGMYFFTIKLSHTLTQSRRLVVPDHSRETCNLSTSLIFFNWTYSRIKSHEGIQLHAVLFKSPILSSSRSRLVRRVLVLVQVIAAQILVLSFSFLDGFLTVPPQTCECRD